VRYSFHGKVRATGQQVDGFVEAANATQAIDRLADQGIIGVYTVRPEAKIPKNAVILSGEAAIETEEEEPPKRRDRPQKSERRPVADVPAPVPAALPAPVPVAPPPAPVSTGTEVVLTQLVDKLSTLLVQVEKLLSRPQQVVYQSGPARGGGGVSGKKSRVPSDVQNNTLRDIFQTNLDLRQSLEKLASTVNAAASPVAARTNGEAVTSTRDVVKPAASVRERPIQAQPAA
jgi:hypothetical protein